MSHRGIAESYGGHGEGPTALPKFVDVCSALWLGIAGGMATEKQKQAARRNLKKARAAKKSATAARQRSRRVSTAERDDLTDSKFAFPAQRKEPLTDAKHVRNAIARFDQVEGVTDRERAAAWKRIKAAAKRYDVEIETDGWRDLMHGGKAN